MATWPSSGGWPASGNWPSAGGWPASGNWPSSGVAPIVPIQWATFFPGAYQVVQTDLGLTYGGTMAAFGTTPPVITLTGSLATAPVPIWVTCTGGGALGVWFGQISYDGGSTVAQAFTSAATVPLTGAGTGLTLNIAAGNANATDNVWKATASALADQSGNAKHYSQATPSKQPIITVGLNGKAGILGDGVDDALISALSVPAPGATAYSIFAVLRQISWTNGRAILGAGLSAVLYQTGLTPQLQNRDAGSGPTNAGAAIGAWVIVEITRSNNASDPYKLGSTTTTGATGNGAYAADGEIFAANNSIFSNSEILALAWSPGSPNWTAVRAAVNSSAGYGVGNVLV